MQESQIMLAVNVPSPLALGYGLALVLLLLGYQERRLGERANALFRAGLVILGVIIAFMAILWFSTQALFSGFVSMSIPDILALGLAASVGGFVMGVGLLSKLRKG